MCRMLSYIQSKLRPKFVTELFELKDTFIRLIGFRATIFHVNKARRVKPWTLGLKVRKWYNCSYFIFISSSFIRRSTQRSLSITVICGSNPVLYNFYLTNNYSCKWATTNGARIVQFWKVLWINILRKFKVFCIQYAHLLVGYGQLHQLPVYQPWSYWAVVVAQLVQQLLPTPEVLGLIPVIGKNGREWAI